MSLDKQKAEVQRRFSVMVSAIQDYQVATAAALNEAEALINVAKKESEKKR